jgi:hypothetical protein
MLHPGTRLVEAHKAAFIGKENEPIIEAHTWDTSGHRNATTPLSITQKKTEVELIC